MFAKTLSNVLASNPILFTLASYSRLVLKCNVTKLMSFTTLYTTLYTTTSARKISTTQPKYITVIVNFTKLRIFAICSFFRMPRKTSSNFLGYDVHANNNMLLVVAQSTEKSEIQRGNNPYLSQWL